MYFTVNHFPATTHVYNTTFNIQLEHCVQSKAETTRVSFRRTIWCSLKWKCSFSTAKRRVHQLVRESFSTYSFCSISIDFSQYTCTALTLIYHCHSCDNAPVPGCCISSLVLYIQYVCTNIHIYTPRTFYTFITRLGWGFIHAYCIFLVNVFLYIHMYFSSQPASLPAIQSVSQSDIVETDKHSFLFVIYAMYISCLI